MKRKVFASLMAITLTLGSGVVVEVSAQPAPSPKTAISDSALDNAKVKCRELGFKAGTEKFGSCVLTLYEKPVAAPAEKPNLAASPAPQPNTLLRPIMSTHTLPPYPPSSFANNETGSSLMEVHITTEGNVDNCKILTSSGSQTLDTAACEHVKQHWLWEPPTSGGKPFAVSERVSVNFDLRESAPPSSTKAGIPLRPIMSTHTVPPYPPGSFAKNQTGTKTGITMMQVHITTEGNVDDCKVLTSSGYEALDKAACEHVQQHWLWQPLPYVGKPVAVSTRVWINWGISNSRPWGHF